MSLAVTYLEGWALAHPVPVFIFIACAGTLAVLAVLMGAENRRDDREDGLPQAPRRGTRLRARGTRARRHAFLGSACRRARAIRAWVTSWFWWCGAWHPWQAARERLALRAHGITIDVTAAGRQEAQQPPPSRLAARARRAARGALRASVYPGRPGQKACPRCGAAHREPHCADGREWGPFPGPETPANAHGITIGVTGPAEPNGPAYDPVTLLRAHPDGPDQTGELVDWEPVEPARLATGAGRDAPPRLDYAPAAPFADCLSDETIARGFPAVK